MGHDRRLADARPWSGSRWRWSARAHSPSWSTALWTRRSTPAIRARRAERCPAGLVKAWELWLFSAIMLAVYLLAVWQLHPVTRWLWPIVLAAFLVYPYTKRFTWLCHFWLGLCLGLAPVGGWAAVTGDALAPPAYVLGVAVLFWTAGFDIIYATQDVECDRARRRAQRAGRLRRRAGARHHAGLARTGRRAARRLRLMARGRRLAVVRGRRAARRRCWSTRTRSSRADDLSRVNAAFFTVNGIIAIVVFAGRLRTGSLG